MLFLLFQDFQPQLFLNYNQKYYYASLFQKISYMKFLIVLTVREYAYSLH